MIRIIWAALIIAALLGSATAQYVTNVYTPLGYVQVTPVTTTSNLNVPSAARAAQYCVESSNAVRYRDDGTAPTATVGMLMTTPTNVCLFYSGSIPSILFQQVTSPAILDISYYR